MRRSELRRGLRAVSLLGWLAVSGCGGVVDVGTDERPPPLDCSCRPVEGPSCPAQPWGADRAVADVDELGRLLRGRWVFCGGERRYTGEGPLTAFFGGAGVELTDESGRWRFHYLERLTPARVRRSAGAANQGDVRLEVTQGTARLVLTPDACPGCENRWELQLFDSPRVLRNAAFDVWNFVPEPPNG